MGANHSNNQGYALRQRTSKAYVLPVIIAPDKLHSSSSFSTIDSMNSDRTTKSSADGFKARDEWYADKEMLASLLATYENGAVLGKGSSAQVFEVTQKATGKKYACKIVRKSFMNDELTMSTETEIMMRLKHENIIQLHELYETSSSRWFIMELANSGTLQTALAEEASYTEELVAGLFKQVLSGVKQLHDMGIVHRDLKQDNILCHIEETASGELKYAAKVADFGLSAVVGMNTSQDAAKMERERKSFRKLKDMWGTKEYFAPEVYKKAYGPQVDVWSLGCVLYELLTGASAFPQREMAPSAIEKYVLNGGKKTRRMYQQRPEWAELSADAQDLLNKMLKVNPKKRFSIQECLEHPFIVNARSAEVMRTCAVNFSSKVNYVAMGSPVKVSGLTPTVVENRVRGKVLVSARNAAIKNAALKARRLNLLAEQIQKDIKDGKQIQ